MPVFNTFCIALVDDDAMYRKILSRILLACQFSIAFEAQDGKDCLSKMKNGYRLPDIVILDIEMPVMDGFQTAKWLKASWPEIKILGHSSIIDQAATDRMIICGADLFQQKGCNQDVLLSTLCRLQSL